MWPWGPRVSREGQGDAYLPAVCSGSGDRALKVSWFLHSCLFGLGTSQGWAAGTNPECSSELRGADRHVYARLHPRVHTRTVPSGHPVTSWVPMHAGERLSIHHLSACTCLCVLSYARTPALLLSLT